MHRSYLFAPGHDAKLVDRVFTAGADLDAVAPLAAGLRLPKVESAEDVQWVVDRCGRDTPPLICAIESARGLLAAHEIALVEADEDGLRAQCEFARSLGFFSKSAIHPRQLPVLHAAFTPSAEEIAWARAVIDAFTAAGGGAARLASGEFVDRARRLLALAAGRERAAAA